jgi:hypothetical protein
MKKLSIVLSLAVLFTACMKDVSVTNPLSENRVINLPYYLMGRTNANLSLDSGYGYRDVRGYYNEKKFQGNWPVYIEAAKFLPDYRSTGTIKTRFTCSKLGIDTTVTLQDYNSTQRIYPMEYTGYYNPVDTAKLVWGKYVIRDSPKVIVNDTVTVYATTSWIQPLQTINVGDTIRIIFK